MTTWRVTAHCAWREFWECSWKGGVNWGELGEQHISSHLNVSQCFRRPIPTGPTRQKLEQIVLSGCTTHPNFFVKGTRWIWDNGMAFVTQHPKLLCGGPWVLTTRALPLHTAQQDPLPLVSLHGGTEGKGGNVQSKLRPPSWVQNFNTMHSHAQYQTAF